MDSDSEAEKAERRRRAQYLSAAHPELPERKARAVVGAEQGFSSSGIAKLPGIDVTQATVKSWLDDVVAQFGDEAVFAKVEAERKGPLGPSERLRKHMPYDPDSLEDEAETMQGEVFAGTILSIEETTAGDVYEDSATDPDREVITLDVKVDVAGSDPILFEDTFTLPTGPQSWGNPNFELGQFKEYYGNLPREGTEVEAAYNDDGFLRIVTSDGDI